MAEFESFLLSWASVVVFRAQSDQRFAPGEYGTSTAASEPLQQLGADTLIKPTHASFTRRKLREHRLAVVQAAQAAEEHAAALQANASDLDERAAAQAAELERQKRLRCYQEGRRSGRRGWDSSALGQPCTEGRKARAREREEKQSEALRRIYASTANEAQQAREAAEQDEQRRAAEQQQRAAEAALQEAALRASAMAAAAAKQEAEAAAKRAAEQARQRRTVGEIFAALLPDGATPTDASGEPISERMLSRKFLVGYAACDSETRRRLLSAAAALVHTVLLQLAPEPLQTAEQLTREMRGVATPDPLRLTLSKARTDKPPRRRLLQLLSQSGLAQTLIESYVAAVERKEKMAVRSVVAHTLSMLAVHLLLP